MEPAKVYQAMMEKGREMAHARHAGEVLDAQTKPMLAQFTVEAKEIEGCSVAEAKEIALSASQYRDHLRSVADARLAYGLAEVAYKAVDALWRAQQTEEANQRAAHRAAP